MKQQLRFVSVFAVVCLSLTPAPLWAQASASLVDGATRATITLQREGPLRVYELASSATLSDNTPPDKRVRIAEVPNHPRVRTGNLLFDGLYALAVQEALQNSVSQIKDGAYGGGAPVRLEAFQTGELWTYVWTRDVSYSTHLALGGFDPERALNSLLFKTSVLKAGVTGGFTNQIIQDTGSGGSYPVSSDRVVWALGASETLKYLGSAERKSILPRLYARLHDTLEQDRHLVFDPTDGLYRGEQSFLDWREQSYPGWTRTNVLTIALSKALSVNAANYFALRTAAEYAGELGRPDEAARYRRWAKDLKAAINQHFYDPDAGLYSTCLLSDGGPAVRVHRYDLLGELLTILLGVADEAQARAILTHYPVGPYGPPVVWPQERTVPIYHNQAIWPFVTAYWVKAARQANCADAVERGIQSLMRGAAFNLSNLENYDFVTGQPEVKGNPLNGPVINSRRQLWSVAGYLAMVQDVVFGLETSRDGLRFRPGVTGKLRRDTFGATQLLELENFAFRGTRNQVRIHLPPAQAQGDGVCGIQTIELNGKQIGEGFVSATALACSNRWDIYLQTPKAPTNAPRVRLVDVSNPRALFGPLPPVWDEGRQDAVTLKDGHLVLHYHHPDLAHVRFNVYRDGQLCAQGITQTDWMDTAATHCSERVSYYALEAIDPETGNASHLSPTRCYHGAAPELVIPAREMENHGGTLVANHHFENWGQPGHDLLVKSFRVGLPGRYALRAEFSNGAGPLNTGITCGVKRLELRKAGSQEVVAAGYLLMPQSGDWQRWDLSSPVYADLRTDVSYSLRIFEDSYSRNMSFLQHNERYTAWPGGGGQSYNYVNIAALRLECLLHPDRAATPQARSVATQGALSGR